MSDEAEVAETKRYPGTPNSSPGLWLALGTVIGFIGGVIAGGGSEGVGVLVASIGGALFAIGIIAKGVEVGIRNARD